MNAAPRRAFIAMLLSLVLACGYVAPAAAAASDPLSTARGGVEAAAVQALRPGSGGTKRFGDVPRDHKFYKPITWMYATGLTTGVKTGAGILYLPNEGLSREAMAAFLYRQAGNPAFRMPVRGFSDVPSSHKFYRAIMWMKSTGLSTGYADGSYRPKDGLSREAMAAFLYRQAGRPAASGQLFSDVSGGHRFAREIRWMRAAGITTGYADGSYRPKGGVSREAMAAFLFRIAGSPVFIESGSVSVVGTAAVAQTLRVAAKGWAPSAVAFSYQWLRNGAVIAGATGASYVLAEADRGKMIQARVTGKLPGATAVSMTSVSTAAVAAKPVTVEEIESRVLYLLNVERQKRGLPLLWKSKYQSKAREWSKHLVDTGAYEHSPIGWYSEMVGENIATAGPRSNGLAVADSIFNSWMVSERHQNVMLSPYAASAAVGIAFQVPTGPGADCDPEFFDCGEGGTYATGTMVVGRRYNDNLFNDINPYPVSGEPTCEQNPSFEECKVPGGRSLPGRTPPNGLWG